MSMRVFSAIVVAAAAALVGVTGCAATAEEPAEPAASAAQPQLIGCGITFFRLSFLDPFESQLRNHCGGSGVKTSPAYNPSDGQYYEWKTVECTPSEALDELVAANANVSPYMSRYVYFGVCKSTNPEKVVVKYDPTCPGCSKPCLYCE